MLMLHPRLLGWRLLTIVIRRLLLTLRGRRLLLLHHHGVGIKAVPRSITIIERLLLLMIITIETITATLLLEMWRYVIVTTKLLRRRLIGTIFDISTHVSI